MNYFQSLKRTMFQYLASKSSTFNISTSLTNCTGDATNPTTIASGGTETLIFTADSGYELPSSVTVTGASYTWEPSTGVLDISNPTGNVSITIVGVEEVDSFLTFSSSSTFTLTTTRSSGGKIIWDGTVEYSTDGNTWNTWNGVSISSSASGKLYLRGTNNYTFTNGGTSIGHFSLTGSNIHLSGNIENLLDYTKVNDGLHPQMSNYCFYHLFYDNSALTEISSDLLSSPSLSENCYEGMFYNSGLTSIPSNLLPVTTLTSNCYESMFADCTGITSLPSDLLPATTLATRCYRSMFGGCTSLTGVCNLPATTLASQCYQYMFNNCTSLKVSETQTSEYSIAFRIPTSGTGTSATESMAYMFLSTGGTFTGTPSINTTYYISNIGTSPGYTVTIQSGTYASGTSGSVTYIDNTTEAISFVAGTTYTDVYSITAPSTTIIYTYLGDSGTTTVPIEKETAVLTQNIRIYQTATRGCLAADTLVLMADGTTKELGNIHIGDMVKSIDFDTMTLTSRRVIQASADEPNPENLISPIRWVNEFSDGTILIQAMKHRIYSLEEKCYKHLSDWTLNMHTYNIEGENPTLISRKLVQEPVTYAQITLEGVNNFFVNGIATGDSECPTNITLDRVLT